MKKTLLFLAAFLCLTILSNAQITKGSILLGGSIGFSSTKTESESNPTIKSNTFTFNPTVGIAVRENWVMGISAGFTNYESEPSATYTYKRDIEGYSGGLFVRRYLSLSKSFYLYGNAAINYQRLNDFTTNDIFNKTRFFSEGVALTIAPGITYAINKRFHLEASLNNLLTAGYSTSNTRNTRLLNGMVTNDESRSKGFDFGTNLNTSIPLTIGFRFIIGK